MEADLARYYHADIRDRWRPGLHGRPALTIRQLAVRLRHLPDDAATTRALNAGHEPWQLGHLLAADLFHAFTGQENPRLTQAIAASTRNRPIPQARLAALERARARAADRRRRIEAGELT